MVDNKELDLLGRLSQTHLADFKSQIQQWLDAEFSRDEGSFRGRGPVQPGPHDLCRLSRYPWDLWNLITKDYDAASKSIERRIATLMDQLDTLSEL